MENIQEHLGRIRSHIDQLLDDGDDGLDKTTLDDVLAGLEDTALWYARAFTDDYFKIADEHQSRVWALEERKEEAASRPELHLGRLTYHTIVPASLGLVASSATYGAVGAAAGLLAEAANQRWWNRTASPAAIGWWGLLGGTAGAVVDYFIDMGMPFFMYIGAGATGTLSALAQADKVVHRDTPETIDEQIHELRHEFEQKGDTMVDQYTKMMERGPQ